MYLQIDLSGKWLEGGLRCGLSQRQFSLVAMTRCTYDPAVKSAYAQARKHLVFRLGDKQTSMQTFALTSFKTLTSTAIYQTATFPGLLQHHEQPPARWVHRQAQKRPFFELSGGLILPKHRSTPPRRRKIGRNATTNVSPPHRGLRPSQATSPPSFPIIYRKSLPPRYCFRAKRSMSLQSCSSV